MRKPEIRWHADLGRANTPEAGRSAAGGSLSLYTASVTAESTMAER
jgi:hypothetical protein